MIVEFESLWIVASLRVVQAIITLATRIKSLRRDGHKAWRKPSPPFDPVGDPTSLSQRWKSWKRRFQTYLVALDVKDDSRNVLCCCIKRDRRSYRIWLKTAIFPTCNTWGTFKSPFPRVTHGAHLSQIKTASVRFALLFLHWGIRTFKSPAIIFMAFQNSQYCLHTEFKLYSCLMG